MYTGKPVRGLDIELGDEEFVELAHISEQALVVVSHNFRQINRNEHRFRENRATVASERQSCRIEHRARLYLSKQLECPHSKSRHGGHGTSAVCVLGLRERRPANRQYYNQSGRETPKVPHQRQIKSRLYFLTV